MEGTAESAVSVDGAAACSEVLSVRYCHHLCTPDEHHTQWSTVDVQVSE